MNTGTTSSKDIAPIEVTIAITQEDESSECATMNDVNAAALCVESGKQVAKCWATLIKREMMSDPWMFPYCMEVTQELEEVAKEYEIFDLRLDGTMVPKVMADYFEKLGYFPEKCYTDYLKGNKDPVQHPCNRAWILYFNTVTVDESFRRRHIGRLVVRKVLEVAMREAAAEGRPLLAGVRPGYLGTKTGLKADSENFWIAMGFERYSVNFQPDLFFWGVALKADPRAVQLRQRSMNFYGLSTRLMDLFEERELDSVLRKTFVLRAAEISLHARKTGDSGKDGASNLGVGGAGDEFMRGMDEWERALFAKSHGGVKGGKEWMENVKKH